MFGTAFQCGHLWHRCSQIKTEKYDMDLILGDDIGKISPDYGENITSKKD